MLDRRQAACCAERVLLYQASTRSSLMGKSCTFAVSWEAEIPTAPAAMRQAGWCRGGRGRCRGYRYCHHRRRQARGDGWGRDHPYGGRLRGHGVG